MSVWDKLVKASDVVLKIGDTLASQGAKSDDDERKRISEEYQQKRSQYEYARSQRTQGRVDYRNDEDDVKSGSGIANQGYDNAEDTVSSNISGPLPYNDLLVGFFEFFGREIETEAYSDEEILNDFDKDILELIMMDYLGTLSDSEQQTLEKDGYWHVLNILGPYLDWKNYRT